MLDMCSNIGVDYK